MPPKFDFGKLILGIAAFALVVGGGIAFGLTKLFGGGDASDNLSKDIEKYTKAKEITVTEFDGSQRTDTLIMIPLNASQDFRNVVYPLIKAGKIKVQKLGNTPNP
jgi:hypothetical protein